MSYEPATWTLGCGNEKSLVIQEEKEGINFEHLIGQVCKDGMVIDALISEGGRSRNLHLAPTESLKIEAKGQTNKNECSFEQVLFYNGSLTNANCSGETVGKGQGGFQQPPLAFPNLLDPKIRM
jgi:hypothetical protein